MEHQLVVVETDVDGACSTVVHELDGDQERLAVRGQHFHRATDAHGGRLFCKCHCWRHHCRTHGRAQPAESREQDRKQSGGDGLAQACSSGTHGGFLRHLFLDPDLSPNFIVSSRSVNPKVEQRFAMGTGLLTPPLRGLRSCLDPPAECAGGSLRAWMSPRFSNSTPRKSTSSSGRKFRRRSTPSYRRESGTSSPPAERGYDPRSASSPVKPWEGSA